MKSFSRTLTFCVGQGFFFAVAFFFFFNAYLLRSSQSFLRPASSIFTLLFCFLNFTGFFYISKYAIKLNKLPIVMSKTNQYLFTFLLNLSTWNPIWSFKKSVTTDKSGVVMKKSICYPSKHELLFHLFFFLVLSHSVSIIKISVSVLSNSSGCPVSLSLQYSSHSHKHLVRTRIHARCCYKSNSPKSYCKI